MFNNVVPTERYVPITPINLHQILVNFNFRKRNIGIVQNVRGENKFRQKYVKFHLDFFSFLWFYFFIQILSFQDSLKRSLFINQDFY